MGTAEDESALIQRAVAGDTGALETLLQSQHERLLGYARKHLHSDLASAIDPADVVQDTFLEACRLFGGFRDEGSDCLFRWLVTITRNKIALLHRRHAILHPKAGLDAEAASERVGRILEELAVYRRTPSKSAAAHELMRALEQSLERLPGNYREVVTLRHLDGLSVADTAARMSRTPEAVYRLCFRALEALRNDLESASIYV
jgi:RNA polymerase sigma-70 factor (ECF subfamily)